MFSREPANDRRSHALVYQKAHQPASAFRGTKEASARVLEARRIEIKVIA